MTGEAPEQTRKGRDWHAAERDQERPNNPAWRLAKGLVRESERVGREQVAGKARKLQRHNWIERKPSRQDGSRHQARRDQGRRSHPGRMIIRQGPRELEPSNPSEVLRDVRVALHAESRIAGWRRDDGV